MTGEAESGLRSGAEGRPGGPWWQGRSRRSVVAGGLIATFIAGWVVVRLGGGAVVAMLGLAGSCAAALLSPALGLTVVAIAVFARVPEVASARVGAPMPLEVLLGCWVLGLVWRLVGRASPRRAPTALLFLLAAYGTVLAASAWVAPASERLTSTLREYGLAAALTLATAAAMRWRSSLLGLRWGLLVAGTLIATLTVLQLLSDRFAPDVWGFARVHEDRLDPPTPFRRAGGPYGDANFYAQALLPVLALSVEASTSPASLATRAFGALASGTTATALAASLSRGALLGAAAMAAVSWPASRRRRGLAVGALVVGVVLLSPARERFAGVFRAISEPAEAEGAIRGRASEMTVAWQMLRDHPLIGVGPGNYQHHYLLYAPPLALDDRGEPRRAHSLYLEVAAESGLLGLALFSAILGGAVAGSWRAGRALAATDPEGARIAAALALGAGGYLVAGFFLHLQFPLPLYLLVGAGWGLMPSERTR